MPHTSHRRKPPPKHRFTVVDENGWTKVVSAPRAPPLSPAQTPSNTFVSKEQSLAFKWSSGDRNVAFELSIPNPVPTPPGATLETLNKRYTTVAMKWSQTKSCIALQEVLKRTLASEDQVQISTCVLVGSGSCSAPTAGRDEVAYYQIAAFRTAGHLIGELQGTQPTMYAQEPLYNDLDNEFLATLDIKVVNHPKGFDLINQSAFVYSPCAEHWVELQIMYYKPQLWLHRALEDRWPLLQDGVTPSDLRSLHWMLRGRVSSPHGTDQEAHHSELYQTDGWKNQLHAEYLINRALFEDFKSKCSGTALPNLAVHNYPFEGVALLQYDPDKAATTP